MIEDQYKEYSNSLAFIKSLVPILEPIATKEGFKKFKVDERLVVGVWAYSPLDGWRILALVPGGFWDASAAVIAVAANDTMKRIEIVEPNHAANYVGVRRKLAKELDAKFPDWTIVLK